MELLRILANAITFLLIGLDFQILVSSKIVKKWNNCPLQFDAIHFVPKISLDECLKHCYIRKRCQLICYRTKLKLCEIHGTKDNSENCKSCVSVVRDDIHTEKFGPTCTCEDSQTCETDVRSCGITECGKLPDPLKEIKGNLAHVGARKIAGCKNGYQGNSTIITCGSDGQWENLPTCDSSGDIIEVDKYRMKIFSQAVTQQEAKDNCEETGFLARMNESTKIAILSKKLLSSSDFASEDYWVDGYSTDLNSWKFSDGTQMPMSKGDFWSSKAPNDKAAPVCVRLQQSFNYLMNDKNCSLQFHYICEIQ